MAVPCSTCGQDPVLLQSGPVCPSRARDARLADTVVYESDGKLVGVLVQLRIAPVPPPQLGAQVVAVEVERGWGGALLEGLGPWPDRPNPTPVGEVKRGQLGAEQEGRCHALGPQFVVAKGEGDKLRAVIESRRNSLAALSQDSCFLVERGQIAAVLKGRRHSPAALGAQVVAAEAERGQIAGSAEGLPPEPGRPRGPGCCCRGRTWSDWGSAEGPPPRPGRLGAQVVVAEAEPVGRGSARVGSRHGSAALGAQVVVHQSLSAVRSRQ
jgi:hypothetical protein